MSDFSNPYAPIDYGKDFNFFAKQTVSNGSYNTNCDQLIRFSTYTVSFQLESGSHVYYSFNGITDSGDMTSGLASANLLFTNRVISKIWFKGAGIIRIEAWSIR